MSFLQILLLVFVIVVVLWFMIHLIGLVFYLAVPALIVAAILWGISRYKKRKQSSGPSTNNDNYSQTTYDGSRKKARDVSTEDVKDDDKL